MKKIQILTSILFVLMTLIVFVQSSSSHVGDMPQVQSSIHTLRSAIGVFVSGGAALAMLLKCIGGATLEQQSPWLFPMFSGLLLLQVHWSLSIPLGLIAVGFAITNLLELFHNARNSTTSTTVHLE